jgi:hypothetical protein
VGMEPFMELCRSRGRSRCGRCASRGVELWSTGVGKRSDIGTGKNSKLLAPLAVGDKLPWRLRRDGEPEWLVVVQVIDDSRYRVRHPDGTTSVLVDSE